MSISNNKNRVKLLMKLHGCASQQFQMDNPHALLHQLAESEFSVDSMSKLTCEQLEQLIDKITNDSIKWNNIEALGISVIPQMGYKQQYLVKKLQKELGWSNEYMCELTIKRYGYLDWQYLTKKSAWAFVNYLIFRNKSKRLKAKKQKELVQ